MAGSLLDLKCIRKASSLDIEIGMAVLKSFMGKMKAWNFMLRIITATLQLSTHTHRIFLPMTVSMTGRQLRYRTLIQPISVRMTRLNGPRDGIYTLTIRRRVPASTG